MQGSAQLDRVCRILVPSLCKPAGPELQKAESCRDVPQNLRKKVSAERLKFLDGFFPKKLLKRSSIGLDRAPEIPYPTKASSCPKARWPSLAVLRHDW